MAAPKKFESGKRYLVDGATLNAILSDIATNRIIPGGNTLKSRVIPEVGTELMLGDIADNARMWDLIPAPAGEGAMTLKGPRVRNGLTDVTAVVSITNATFVPAAGSWVIATITSLTAPAIVISQVSTWDSYPNAYEFDGSNQFVSASLPIWQFTDTAAAHNVRVSEGVYGEKHVGDGPLWLFTTLVAVPETTIQRAVPHLV